MYRYSQNPKLNIFNKISKLKNIKLINNFEMNQEKFKKIERNFDKFVLANGGVLNYNSTFGFINSLDVIKQKVYSKDLGPKICIIGMGNVSIDLVKILLKENRSIDVCSRKNLFESKFGNAEMRDLINNNEDIQINLINVGTISEKYKNDFERRRYEMFRNTAKPSLKKLNLRFNTEIEEFIKKGGKYLLKFNTGEEIAYDSVISSLGFLPNELELKTKKPIYKLGWCDVPRGNINDALYSAKKLASKILS